MARKISTLFASGDIRLSRMPIDGRMGINSMWAALLAGSFGFKYDGNINNEIWLVTVTRNRQQLRILHADVTGRSLIIRKLWGGCKFLVSFDDGQAFTLNSAQLRRLVLDGTMEGDYQTTTAELLLR